MKTINKIYDNVKKFISEEQHYPVMIFKSEDHKNDYDLEEGVSRETYVMHIAFEPENISSNFSNFTKGVCLNVVYDEDIKDSNIINRQLVFMINNGWENYTRERFEEAHLFIVNENQLDFFLINDWYQTFINGAYPNNLFLLKKEILRFFEMIKK